MTIMLYKFGYLAEQILRLNIMLAHSRHVFRFDLIVNDTQSLCDILILMYIFFILIIVCYRYWIYVCFYVVFILPVFVTANNGTYQLINDLKYLNWFLSITYANVFSIFFLGGYWLIYRANAHSTHVYWIIN